MEDTEVLIVGGGGCGLTMSSLLSNYGVQHLLFEQHSSTSRLPKSHLLNQRTMEIFRQHDLHKGIIAKGADERFFRRVTWRSSFGGGGAEDRRLLASLSAFPGANIDNKDAPHGPTSSVNLPQIRLEPLLKDLATSKNVDGIWFGHKVSSIDDTDSGAIVTVIDDKDRERKIRTKYVIGADGGRFVGGVMGCKLEGITNIYRVITVHFRADLSQIWVEDDIFLANVAGPHGEAGIAPMGPTWGRNSEEWIIHISHPPNETIQTNGPDVRARIAAITSLPEDMIEILTVSTWAPECVLADVYRKGHILIAGDAAHRHPPTGGLGLNTAVADVHNLAWKLALVLRHGINECILDTYEQERRASGRRNCDWALMALLNRRVLAAAMSAPAQLKALSSNPSTLESTMAHLQAVVDTQRIEFSAHDLEIGHVYPSGLFVSDEKKEFKHDRMGQVYYPSTRPGHRLPHCWLHTSESSSPGKVSTHDLVGQELKFVLVTDPSTDIWKALSRGMNDHLKDLVRLVVVFPQGNNNVLGADEYIDGTGRWAELSELKPGGALLIRPDNYIAWRSVEPDETKVLELLDVINKTIFPPHD